MSVITVETVKYGVKYFTQTLSACGRTDRAIELISSRKQYMKNELKYWNVVKTFTPDKALQIILIFSKLYLNLFSSLRIVKSYGICHNMGHFYIILIS